MNNKTKSLGRLGPRFWAPVPKAIFLLVAGAAKREPRIFARSRLLSQTVM